MNHSESVPAAGPEAHSPLPMRGILSRIGTFLVGDEESTGYFVAAAREEIEAIKHLPMHRHVVIMTAADHAAAQEQIKALKEQNGRLRAIVARFAGWHGKEDAMTMAVCNMLTSQARSALAAYAPGPQGRAQA